MPITMTPLRYPGGKSQLYKYTKNLILNNNLTGCIYSEPYAGGCGLALQLLFDNLVEKLILNDIDRSIYSFWWSVLNDKDSLITKIKDTPVTIDEWHRQKDIQSKKNTVDLPSLGFSTFFLNRTNYSGIIGAGPIGGVKQIGNYKLDCRYKKADLIRKIEMVHSRRDSIEFHNKDAVVFFEELNRFGNNEVFVFLDPPYFEKGPELYTNFYNVDDHINLAKHISTLNQNWVVTYDNTEEIKAIYRGYEFGQKEYSLRYSARKNSMSTEVMFFSKNIVPSEF